MIMLRLSEQVWVASDQIAGVLMDRHGEHVTVRMKDGEQHSVENDYGVSAYTTRDRLVEKINHAVTTMRVNAEGYAVAPVARWHYPAAGEPAPHGAHVQLLTVGGKQVAGIWRDSGSYIAWAPQLKRDKELEAQLKLS